ncbi:terminase large subunit, partial [Escherichia coli]|nr:terminase large subunit [Escherichia coli]
NEGYEVNEVRQGFRTLSEPIKYTKELMIRDKFNHMNNPLLKWCTANAVAKYDSNENVILDKDKSINRIDAIASTVTAMVNAMLHNDTTSIDDHIDDEYKIW